MNEKKTSQYFDRDFIQAIINDDVSAFKKLYCYYFPKLTRFAWYRTFSMEISKDLVQELFCNLWAIRKKLNPNKSLNAYLYKSINNLIINYYKRHSTNNILIEEIKENALSQSPNIESILDIKTAILQLPEKIKIVFLLSRYDGMSYEEIADICDISKKAVEKRMGKAFKILRKTFSKKYYNSQ